MDLLLPAIGLAVALICLLALFLVRRRSSAARPTGQTPDPLAEAEVYLAYGKKKEALETLEKAASSDPSRADIATKLAQLKRHL
jgi:hypothetical protein